jgi:DNA polymerase III epsilon subunit-like protein
MGIAILIILVLALGTYFYFQYDAEQAKIREAKKSQEDWDRHLEEKHLKREADFKLFRERFKKGFSSATDDKYPKFLFIDFETTDLPYDYSVPSLKQIAEYPYIVQAGILVFNERAELISSYQSIFKTPSEVVFSPEAVRIHKITKEVSNTMGNDIVEMFDFLKNHINGSTILIAHNLKFDNFFLKLEAKRNGIKLPKLHTFCTMKNTVEICAIDKEHGSGYKYPKLKELAFHAFTNGQSGNLQLNLHDAMTDIKLCAMCFFELKLHQNLVVSE